MYVFRVMFLVSIKGMHDQLMSPPRLKEINET